MEQLLNLYGYESVHGTEDETAIADYICEEIVKAGGKYEREGNTIYNFNDKTQPILSAHLDQVKTNGQAVHFAKGPDGIIKAWNSRWQRTSLGADDKNGVWIILQLLKKYPKLNFIISEGEEAGCIGISRLDNTDILSENISDKQFCIVLDRRGNGDVLSGGAGGSYCKTLAQDICNYLEDDKLAVTTGSISDTRTICKYCESVNMSVAYEAAHTANETTDFNRLQELLAYVDRLISGDFVHYSTKPSVYATTTSTNYYQWKNTKTKAKNDDDDDYWDKWRNRYGYY